MITAKEAKDLTNTKCEDAFMFYVEPFIRSRAIRNATDVQIEAVLNTPSYNLRNEKHRNLIVQKLESLGYKVTVNNYTTTLVDNTYVQFDNIIIDWS